MTPYTDALARVVGAQRPMTMPQRALDAMPHAGEWDWLRAMPLRQRRSLIGAGYLTAGGWRPDRFADLIADGGAGVTGIDAAMDWYVTHAVKAIGEGRRERHHDRHERFAREQGARSYYDFRDTWAVLDGYGSLWHKRKAMGWV